MRDNQKGKTGIDSVYLSHLIYEDFIAGQCYNIKKKYDCKIFQFIKLRIFLESMYIDFLMKSDSIVQ